MPRHSQHDATTRNTDHDDTDRRNTAAHVTHAHITCADGHPLATTWHHPTPNTTPQPPILIAPATGIRRHFYAPLATALAHRGHHVLTYDNRGIGGSLIGHVRDSDATLTDWGSLDLPAVAQHLHHHTGNQPIHVIGHSAGGQLVGLMPNHHLIASIYNVACSSGSIHLMRPHDQPKGRFFIQAFLPATTWALGYAPNHLVGMGEPLPAGVAKHWSTCCQGHGYTQTLFGTDITEHWYDRIAASSMWTNASDDFIATDAAVTEMTNLHSSSAISRHTFTPADAATKTIGHMGYFWPGNHHLWNHLYNWLNTHATQPAC